MWKSQSPTVCMWMWIERPRKHISIYVIMTIIAMRNLFIGLMATHQSHAMDRWDGNLNGVFSRQGRRTDRDVPLSLVKRLDRIYWMSIEAMHDLHFEVLTTSERNVSFGFGWIMANLWPHFQLIRLLGSFDCSLNGYRVHRAQIAFNKNSIRFDSITMKKQK